MTSISCHVLDASIGKPAPNVHVSLRFDNHIVAASVTNEDGRCGSLVGPASELILQSGTYKLRFETFDYFKSTQRHSFFPYVEVAFVISDPAQHYHIPLLLSPYSYTTYRGS